MCVCVCAFHYSVDRRPVGLSLQVSAEFSSIHISKNIYIYFTSVTAIRDNVGLSGLSTEKKGGGGGWGAFPSPFIKIGESIIFSLDYQGWREKNKPTKDSKMKKVFGN